MFGHAAPVGDQLLYSSAGVESVRRDWAATIRKAGTDVVVLDTNTPLPNVLAQSPRWVRVYKDPHNVAFVARDHLAALALPPPPTYPRGDPCARLNALKTLTEQSG